MRRLNERISRSKRWGKLVLVGVLAVSLPLGLVLIQALTLALEAERWGPTARAGCGLALLLAVDLFSILAIRRQHRLLDEARDELEEMIRLPTDL